MKESYGSKRDYPKIDIYLRHLNGQREYHMSTTWSRTCKEAKARFLLEHNYLDAGQVTCSFSIN
jgi:hypothetical protein